MRRRILPFHHQRQGPWTGRVIGGSVRSNRFKFRQASDSPRAGYAAPIVPDTGWASELSQHGAGRGPTGLTGPLPYYAS